MKKYLALAALLTLCAPAIWAQKEYGLKFSSLINDNLTLENAIRIGLENNTDFLAAKEEITIAQQKVREAKFLFLPQISLQGTATWYDLEYPMVLPDSVANRFIPSNDLLPDAKDHFFGAGVSATQYLYSGGRMKNALKMARANLKQVQSKYDTVKNAVVRSIKTAFFQLLWAQQQAQFAAQTLQTAQTYYKNARVNSWDKIRARALLARQQSAYNQAAGELKKAELAMLVALNKELNSRIKVQGDFIPPHLTLDLPHLNLWSMEFRPELKAAIYALELDNLAIDLALSKRYPDVILQGSYEQLGFDDLEDVNKQVSLAVRLPLPYTLGTQYAQKQAEQRQSTLKRSAIEDKIRAQVAQRFETLVFWQTEVQTRREAFDDVQTLFSSAQKNMDKTGLSPLQALEAYSQTVYAYYEGIRESLVAKAELEWAIGKDL